MIITVTSIIIIIIYRGEQLAALARAEGQVLGIHYHHNTYDTNNNNNTNNK